MPWRRRNSPAASASSPSAITSCSAAPISDAKVWLSAANLNNPDPGVDPMSDDWRFETVTGSSGERRDFRITLGLREGWKRTGRIYDIEEAVRAAHDWMKRRADAGQPFLSGMFTRGEVVYAWPGGEGTAGSDREPVAIFTGEVLPLYSGDLDDAAIRSE